MQVASKNSLVPRAPTPVAAGLVLAATLLLGACGQKGALRLAPEPVAAPPATSAASAASAPAR